jgi:ketosteroid isomerase-like protein
MQPVRIRRECSSRRSHSFGMHLKTDEIEAVATLHRLNGDYLRAVAESDTDWFDEHLSDDFVCTLAHGQRINKAEFLQRTARGGVSNLTYDEIDVRPLGDFALVHGVTHSIRDDSPMSIRYTDVWRLLDGRWQAVAAQLTRVS